MFGERSEVPIPSQEGYSDLSVLVRRDVVQAQKKTTSGFLSHQIGRIPSKILLNNIYKHL
jgi:hypothetical protein